jgi:hypothetical protein
VGRVASNRATVPRLASLHTAATATTIPAAVLGPDPAVLCRMGRVWGSGLARGPLGAPGECQQKEEHGEAFVPAHHFVGLTRTANVPRTGSSARQPISAGLITHPVKPSASTSFDDLVGTGED